MNGAPRELYRSGLQLRKPWGIERLIARAPGLELWELRMEAGSTTSLHLHRTKHTGLACLSGRGRLAVDSGTERFVPIDCRFIAASTPHRIEASHAALVWELESPPDKEDIERLEDRYGRAGRPFLFGSTVLPAEPTSTAAGPAPRHLLNVLLATFAREGVAPARDADLGRLAETMMEQVTRWSSARF